MPKALCTPEERAARKAAYKKAWAQANAEKIRERRRAWYLANREEVIKKSVAWAHANPERTRGRLARWTRENKENLKQRRKKTYAANRDSAIKYAKAWRAKNKTRVNANYRKLYAANSAPQKEATLRYIEKNRVAYVLSRLRTRARKSGIPFNLTADDLHFPATCPVLGIPLDAKKVGRTRLRLTKSIREKVTSKGTFVSFPCEPTHTRTPQRPKKSKPSITTS